MFPINGLSLKSHKLLGTNTFNFWLSDITSKEIYDNYKMFKTCLILKIFCKICSLTLHLYWYVLERKTRLPIQRRRIQNIPFEERICTKCNSEDTGDEFHYIFPCGFYSESRKKKIFHSFIVETQMLSNSTVSPAVKRNLAHVLKVIMK